MRCQGKWEQQESNVAQEVTRMAAVDIIYVTSNAGVERKAGRAAGGLMFCKHNTTEVSLTLSTPCAESSGKSKQI